MLLNGLSFVTSKDAVVIVLFFEVSFLLGVSLSLTADAGSLDLPILFPNQRIRCMCCVVSAKPACQLPGKHTVACHLQNLVASSLFLLIVYK